MKPDGIYVDATLGGGGHAYEVASRLSDKGRFIGIDQDADAIEAAGARLSGFGEKVTIIRSNYCDMKPRLHEIGIDKVDGIVIDLGVSSYQLDTAERGFSYRTDAPLDMRMDQRLRQQKTLSMTIAKRNFTVSSVIMEKINLQRILQNTL